MLTRQNKIQHERKELRRDPRLGRRVICRAFLPTITLLGTLQGIVRYADGVEYWNVRTDGPLLEEAPASHFIPYNGPEFEAGQRVRYHLEEGGCWRATVLRPRWSVDHLRYLIRVDTSEHAAIQARRGQTFAAHPAQLDPLSMPPHQESRKQQPCRRPHKSRSS